MGFQQELIDSAVAQGGYGRKVAHAELKGISDLLIQMPGFSMVQVECKDLGTLKKGFDVKANITEHQKSHIDALNDAARGRVAFYCFRVKIGETVACFFHTYYVERIVYDFSSTWTHTIEQRFKGSWPGLGSMWNQLGVMKIVDPTINPLAARS